MDADMYNAAMKGQMEYGDLSLVDYLNREQENGYQVTPNGNTILHVAALFGQQGFVGEVLKISPALLCYKNKKNETALHIAANVGQTEVVSELLNIEGKETLVRMTDDIGDTALHKAVRGGHIDIVRILVKLLLDPERDFPTNKAGETPLYLAAESGFHDVLIEILNICKEPTYVAGPFKRTPLHAAIIHVNTKCVRSLWEWHKPLCEAADVCGWNSLHYAVKQGLTEIVSDMLGWKKSLAYTRAGSENKWTTAFHIAAREGHKSMIHELLKHCPDCWDMVNSNGQNVLHAAILNCCTLMFLKELLEWDFCNSLVDEADNEGNTPLHLLAAYGDNVLQMILDHPSSKKMLFNKQKQTPLDILYSRKWTTNEVFWAPRLRNINVRLGQRCAFEAKNKNGDQGKAKEEIDKIMKSIQIHIVVAALIMTVAFTAGFTLPGGLDSIDGPNKGLPILIKKPAFAGFIVSNVLAFTCAAAALPIYFRMANYGAVHDDVIGRGSVLKVLRRDYSIANFLQIVAMYAVVVVFVSGTYATLGNSLLVVFTICFIGVAIFALMQEWIQKLRQSVYCALEGLHLAVKLVWFYLRRIVSYCSV